MSEEIKKEFWDAAIAMVAEFPGWDNPKVARDKLYAVRHKAAGKAVLDPIDAAMYVRFCLEKGVDPLSNKRIHAWTNKSGELEMMAGVHVMRELAHATGRLVFEYEPTYFDKDGKEYTRWTAQEPPFIIRACIDITVDRLGEKSVERFCREIIFHELYPNWKYDTNSYKYTNRAPVSQGAKCAIAKVFREAFPKALGGMYEHAEQHSVEMVEERRAALTTPVSELDKREKISPTQEAAPPDALGEGTETKDTEPTQGSVWWKQIPEDKAKDLHKFAKSIKYAEVFPQTKNLNGMFNAKIKEEFNLTHAKAKNLIAEFYQKDKDEISLGAEGDDDHYYDKLKALYTVLRYVNPNEVADPEDQLTKQEFLKLSNALIQAVPKDVVMDDGKGKEKLVRLDMNEAINNKDLSYIEKLTSLIVSVTTHGNEKLVNPAIWKRVQEVTGE